MLTTGNMVAIINYRLPWFYFSIFEMNSYMAVIAFQVFIFLTIAITRLISKKHLIHICCGWTAFTFLEVFFSPLLLLQLATIWISFLALRPENSNEFCSATDVRETENDVPHSIESNSENEKSEPLASFGKFVSDVNGYVTQHAAVQYATSEIEISIQCEKTLIEASMSEAKGKISQEKMRAEKDARWLEVYDQERAKIRAILEGVGQEAKSTVEAALPIFDVPRKRAEPEIEEAVEKKFRRLKNDRNDYLSKIVESLRGDEQLFACFEKELHKLGGVQIMRNIARLAASENRAPVMVPIVAENSIFSALVGGVANLPKAMEQDSEIIAPLFQAPTMQVLKSKFSIAEIFFDVQRAQIKSRAELLGIKFLVHFTKVENLPSILLHGIRPASMLDIEGVRYHGNDGRRLDGHRFASCLSIAHPNDRMFAKYRWEKGAQDWVVLVLNPSILWTMNPAFFKHNAADHRVRNRSFADRTTDASFSDMFLPVLDLPSREEGRLMEFDPTDVQAEVLVSSVIPPDAVDGVVFGNADALARYRNCVGEKRVSLHAEGRGFFGARTYARKTGWSY